MGGTNCQHVLLQVIVRFGDKSSVVCLPGYESTDESRDRLLSIWSTKTGWPLQFLKVSSWDPPFATITSISSLRGGKGGFGTLLKGQSRQAGAKLTTDFGACRDLQGRRLRHVNDEIKLRKWRETKRREQAGEKVPDDELWKTPSGIYNWHLMTPTWADVSKKATHRIKRQFQQLGRQASKEALKKKEQEVVYQNSMTHYLEQATAATETIQKSIPDAIQQGLAAAAASKKRKLPMEGAAQLENAEPNSLVTLSGDMVVDSPDLSTASSGIKIQSKSDFGTAVLILDHAAVDQTSILYYEVTLVTGGLAQIGWASIMGEIPFAPSDDLGDGVGDDSASFAVDGSRQLKFHAGIEEAYPLKWKEGDRLGCSVNAKEGTIGFTINGVDCGRAFQFDKELVLVPAFSCNQGQILQLHTTKADCKFFPAMDAVAVSDLVIAQSTITETFEDETESTIAPQETLKTPYTSDLTQLPTNESPPLHQPTTGTETMKPEILDLTLYNSAKDLELLGLDRLKNALMALQVKCGGTLTERAERLFSLKGLSRMQYPTKVRAKSFRQ